MALEELLATRSSMARKCIGDILMIIYDGTKVEFIDSVVSGGIVGEIEQRLLKRMGRHTGSAELASWNNSLVFMQMVLNDSTIPSDAGIAIEYNVPQTSKRIDFMVSGYDKDSKPYAVLIELKQWSELEKVEGPDALVRTFTGGAKRTVVHPSY